MNILQATNLQQNDAYSALVSRNDDLIKRVMNAATTEGTWELATNEWSRPILRLRLRDRSSEQGTGDFAPEELQNEACLESRLHGLKDALLYVESWRTQVRELFERIRTWCQKLPGGATFKEEPIFIREVRSGEYEMPRLVITSGNRTMRVEPVAAWCVGADGRVDLRGVDGPFVLLYSRDEDIWHYQHAYLPLTMTPLTEEVFLDLAEACLHG